MKHEYRVTVEWTGNLGSGTETYGSYSRDHAIRAGGKEIAGSSDASFRGDESRWNPEELLVASLAACHKLWYLHLCAVNGIAVLSYVDDAEGVMVTDGAGSGKFTSVTLHPRIVVATGADLDVAERLHHEAHALCFIANSVNFPVNCSATITPQLQPSFRES